MTVGSVSQDSVRSLRDQAWRALPALLPIVVALVVLDRQAGVSATETLRFVGYVAVVITFPGATLWWFVNRRRRVSLFEHLAVGTTVGFAAELPVYLLGRAVGVPHLALISPVLALGAWAILHRQAPQGGRRVAPPDDPASPWSLPAAWSLSLVLSYVVLWSGHQWWGPQTRMPDSLQHPYVDEPYHLALVGELRHHVPADFPYVDGVQLFYHWLVYAHLASASWLTGIEAIQVLRTVGMLGLALGVALGVVGAIVRLTGKPWYGVVGAALLTFAGTASLSGWDSTGHWAGAKFLSTYMFLSPTYALGLVLVVPLVLCAALLLRDDRLDPRLVLLFAALVPLVGGAKSSTLPTMIGALLGTAVLQGALRRRFPVVPATLAGVAVIGFLLAQRVFYGSGTRALELSPFQGFRARAVTHGLAESVDTVPAAVLAVIVISWLLAQFVAGAGAVGLLVRGGWREPLTQFMIGVWAAGAGAALILYHPSGGQIYFLLGTLPVAVLVSTLGLARLIRGGRRDPVLACGAVASGILLTLLIRLLSSEILTAKDGESAGAAVTRLYLAPQLAALALLIVVVVGMLVLARRRVWPRSTAVLVAVCLTIGCSITTQVALAPSVLTQRDVSAPVRSQLIPPGGVEAARWIRDHSDPSDVVATNSHCLVPRTGCDRRAFWVSAYSERRVLVEGWAYIPPSAVGLPSNDVTNSSLLPFWDKELLSRNDRAFRNPDRAKLQSLRTELGVRWLLVDTRYRHRLPQLRRHAEERFAEGEVVVLEILDD